MAGNVKKKKGLSKLLFGKGRVSTRLRNINISLFLVSFLIITLAMYTALSGIIDRVSVDYAERYAVSSSEVMSTRLYKDISLLSRGTRTKAVRDWLRDESNETKKLHAYNELSDIAMELYSPNIYIGTENSRYEYRVGDAYASESIAKVAKLDVNNTDNNWYFRCIESEEPYVLDVDVDHLLNKKRVWIDYRVAENAEVLGVIATGLEFSHVAGELFSQYDSNGMRGLIIDDRGIIHIDSARLNDESYLKNEFDIRIEDIFNEKVLIEAVNTYLAEKDGYHREMKEPLVIILPSSGYRYVSISPIVNTGWSVIIMHDSTSMLGMSLFVPVVILVLLLLIVFAALINSLSNRIVFKPLGRLVDSLEKFKENQNNHIYGIERDDEFGELSNTITDLFTKANYDVLTGIYNRRYMESNLPHIMELLSRSGGMLSVMMVDIDFFKNYNDALGHDQGDVCLKHIAGEITKVAERANDFAARYGGEEFIIVLPNADETGARSIAQKLLENIRQKSLPHPDSSIAANVTVSVGVTTGKVSHEQSWEEYVKKADEALYFSKQNGRDRYTWIDSDTQHKLS